MDSEAIYIKPHHNGTAGQFIAWLHQPGKPDFPMCEGSADDCIRHVNQLCRGAGWESVEAYIEQDGVCNIVPKSTTP